MTHFLGFHSSSRGTKKQNSVAFSIAASCCAQLLWIKQQPEDFGVITHTIPLLCDNTSALNMAMNPVKHKRTKHIYVRTTFLRDNAERRNICMQFCKTEDQIVDIFTKLLRTSLRLTD